MIDEGEEPGITSPDYVVFRTRAGVIHPRWFYYWLRSSDGAAFIKSLTRGAVRERLLFRRLADAEIDLPPYEMQLRFSKAVALVGPARAAAAARFEAAQLIAGAALREMFSSFERWPSRPIGEVCELLPSRSIVSTGSTRVRAVTTACLRETGFDPTGVKDSFMEDAIAASESRVRTGEVLVARSNTAELVGRAAMFPGEPAGVVASDLTIRLMPRVGVLSEFVTAYLSFLYLSGYWKEKAAGASGSMKKITRTQISQKSIPIPSAPEQERLVEKLRSRMSLTSSMRQSCEAVLAHLDLLPAALLRRAFCGEL